MSRVAGFFVFTLGGFCAVVLTAGGCSQRSSGLDRDGVDKGPRLDGGVTAAGGIGGTGSGGAATQPDAAPIVGPSSGGGATQPDAAGPISPADAAVSPPGTGTLGERCVTPSDCSPGLTCLTEDSTALMGGGVQQGVCTVDCSNDVQACTSFDPTSFCVAVNDRGTPRDPSDDVSYCFEGCAVGASGTQCHGRPEMACYPSTPSTTAGYCSPTCTSDYACGNRVCDLGLGVCVDVADRPPGLPIGSACDPANDQCEAVCTSFAGGIDLCTGLCSLSGLFTGTGCGSDPTSTAPLDVMCLYADSLAGPSDLGLCGQLCDCNDDCLHPAMICEPLPAGTGLVELTLRAGLCTLSDPTSGTIGIACAN